MRLTLLGVVLLSIFGYSQEVKLNGKQILQQSITEHDPLNVWNHTKLHLHIQEPRISNPHRYSILQIDNSTNTFELSRNRDQYISKHSIKSDGNAYTLLNDKKVTDTLLIKKYRLETSRVINYKKFYTLFYGIPMSLNTSIKKITNTTTAMFNRENCYKIEVELTEKMISKYWNIFISKSNYIIKGIEIIFPNQPNKGDRIYYNDSITVNGIKIPRIRNWHELSDDSYSGTDIIIKEISKN